MTKFALAAAATIAALAAPSAAAMDAAACIAKLTGVWTLTQTDGSETITFHFLEDGVAVAVLKADTPEPFYTYGAWGPEAGPSDNACVLSVMRAQSLVTRLVLFDGDDRITSEGQTYTRVEDAPPPPAWTPGEAKKPDAPPPP